MARTTVDAAASGRACPYCRFPLKESVAAYECDHCGALHHEDCWRDGGGCAVLGCPGTAGGTAVYPPPTTPPPPQPPTRAADAGTPPVATPPKRSGNTATGVLLGLVIALALVVVGGGAYLLFAGESTKQAGPPDSGPTSTQPPSGTEDPQTPPDEPEPTVTEGELAQQIEAIVEYSQEGRTAVRTGRFQEAIDNREEVLIRIDDVRGTTGRLAAAKRELRAAMEASLASDHAYANGGDASATDAEATRRKRAFVRIWNRIAADHGLRQYEHGGI